MIAIDRMLRENMLVSFRVHTYNRTIDQKLHQKNKKNRRVCVKQDRECVWIC